MLITRWRTRARQLWQDTLIAKCAALLVVAAAYCWLLLLAVTHAAATLRSACARAATPAQAEVRKGGHWPLWTRAE